MRKVLVLSGDGINSERELGRGFSDQGAEVTYQHVNELLKNPATLKNYQLLAIPGGFSFGDELRSGKILAEKLRDTLSEVLTQFLKDDGRVIGICNGFQVLAQLGVFDWETGERIFTKWGFREILEKGAASILQPDLCHAGGITEGRIIAGMAEAYYVPIAPHNPMGPISLAVGLQLAASIPNFLVQEQVTLGEGYLKNPFKLQKDGTVLVPKGPGLGVELDEALMADKIGHDWKNPETYNALDGSVVDW
jgi:putative intracellular protease/amidase